MGKHIRNPKHKMKYLVTGGAGFIGSNLVVLMMSLQNAMNSFIGMIKHKTINMISVTMT